jgi:hypothetical protein
MTISVTRTMNPIVLSMMKPRTSLFIFRLPPF